VKSCRATESLDVTDEVEKKPEALKTAKPSDATVEAAQFAERSKQTDWETASEPLRTSQKHSATHELLSDREVAELQAKGQAGKFEIVDLSSEHGNGSAEDTGTVIDYKPGKLADNKTYSLGMDYEEVRDTRSVYQRLGDFATAAGRRASDPEGFNKYIQGELDKMIGVGEGLNLAKEQTKGAVGLGWKALTDGTVATFLSKPNAINDPLFHAVGGAITAMAEDPNAVNHALEKVGTTIMNASERYSRSSNREQGHVIGETMFALVNPEGSAEGGKLALQIAAGAATQIDLAVINTIKQTLKATKEAAEISPELATQTKQILLDYLQSKGLVAGHEYAGVPKGFFDGLQPTEVAAKDNYFAMSKADDLTGDSLPKKSNETLGESVSEIEFQVDARTGRLQRTDLGRVREPYCWPVLNERFCPDVTRQKFGDSCVSAVGETLSGGRLKETDLIDIVRGNYLRLPAELGTEWSSKPGPAVLPDLDRGGPWLAELHEGSWTDYPGRPHTVIVDGPNANWEVKIRDPYEGTRYEMKLADFKKAWTGRCVYRKVD